MIYIITPIIIFRLTIEQYMEYVAMDSPTGYTWQDLIERTEIYQGRIELCRN